jgi:hypothetical protein
MLLLISTWSCTDEVNLKKQDLQEDLPKDTESTTRSSSARTPGNEFWYFYRGATTDYIYYAHSSDGETWQGDQRINSTSTTPCSPAAIYFNGQFIVAYRGKTNPYIHLDFSEDGIHWGGGKRLSTAFTTLTTPNFAVVNNMLSLFYVNECPNCTLRNFVYAQHGFTRRQIGPGIFRPGRANMACFFL